MTEVTITSVVKTPHGNQVNYQIHTDDAPFLAVTGFVKAKSTNNIFKPFGSLWNAQVVQNGVVFNSNLVDGWTANRKEERTYKVRILDYDSAQSWESEPWTEPK
jgi:hypothetical protein